MKLDRFFTDFRKAIERVLHAFDHNITVQDNFGASGAPAGFTIVSRGPEFVPVWAEAGSIPGTDDEGGEGSGGGTGPTGPAGPQGPPGPAAEINFDKIVTADFTDLGDVVGAHVVIAEGNVIWAEFD